MKTILFEDNNDFRIIIAKAISKCLDISVNKAYGYARLGSITLPDELCKNLIKLLDPHSIKYSISNEIVQELPKEEGMSIVESGICKVESVYILTKEAFDELTKYKLTLKKLSNILSELNISDNE